MMNINVDVVMSMYNSIEYRDNYSKSSGSLWKYCRDEPALIDPGTVENPKQILQEKLTYLLLQNTNIAVPLKYLSNFWKTLEMLLINCEFNLILTWSSTCVIATSTGAGTSAVTDKKFYVPVETLSTQVSVKLLEPLTYGLKEAIN